MKTIGALKSIFQTIIQTSILTGALFFCPLGMYGAISDTTSINDTITYTPADSLKARKLALIRHDTIQDTFQNTIQEESVKQHDTIYTPTEKELLRMMIDHSPHKATIFSAVLPGLGQAYNRKYWKIPIIYFAGYWLYSGLGFEWGWKYYNDYYHEFKELYQQEYYNPEGDKNYEDLYKKNMSYARKKRDMITIWMGVLYVANIVDAMADAHFYNFDISDDLSLRLLPSISTPDPYVAYNDYSLGLKLRLKF